MKKKLKRLNFHEKKLEKKYNFFHFSSTALKTNQLEVNTDVRTLRPIARLKEPRDLFALPKERDNECTQQLPRWPNECQVRKELLIIHPDGQYLHFIY